MPFLGKTPAQIVDPEVDIDGGSIDGATIGATSASAATVTTFTSTGIDDNATSTAITIDSSENVGIGVTTGTLEGVNINNSYNLGFKEGSGDSVANMFRQTTSGALILAQGYKRSGTANGFASSSAGEFTRAAVSVTNGVKFYVDAAVNVAEGTDYTPTERMRIDSSGNVGIGTTSPDAPLTITEASNVAINILKSSGNSLLKIGEDGSNHAVYNALYNEHIFQANGSERMRIDNSGNLLVGKTSVSGNQGHTLYSSGLYYIHIDGTGSSETVRFYRNGGAIKAGWITTSGTGTTYNSLSDLRLKENITDAPAGNIDNIRVRSFDWKLTGEHQTYGMVAQELVEVAPEAVSQGDTDDDMWGVDYSKLVPMMIKEIQDLKAEVAALKGAN